MTFFDDLETRSSDQRSTENAALLKDILNLAVNLDGYEAILGGVDLSTFKSLEDLSSLPVLRKSELSEKQVKVGLIVSIKFKLKLQLVKLPETSETVIVISVSELIKEPGNGNCDMIVLLSQLSENIELSV